MEIRMKLDIWIDEDKNRSIENQQQMLYKLYELCTEIENLGGTVTCSVKVDGENFKDPCLP